jgi:hypothetical protein
MSPGTLARAGLLSAVILCSGSPVMRAEQGDPAAMFAGIASVLQHPRCLNCHTMTEFPRQGDDRHPHLFGVLRGEDDRGAPWTRCASCHGSANNNATGVPGRPDWHLAPLKMGWEGLSTAELCRRLLSPANNGNRSPQQIADHIVQDQQLVAWAWSPGRNLAGVMRSTPPMPRDDFNRVVERWVAAGAPCPN